MARLANNGTGKSTWKNTLGALLAKGYAGDVFDGMNVVQQSSAAMSVKVQPGLAIIRTGSAPAEDAYLVRHDTSGGFDLSLTSDSSNPRRSLIIEYFKTSAVTSSSVDGPDSLNFLVVPGTAAASPIDPNPSAIQAAIQAAGGSASDPYNTLARVRLGAGATQITQTMIDDLRTLAAPISPRIPLTEYPGNPGGFSAVPAGASYTYERIKNMVTIFVSQPNNGTSNSTSFTIDLPFKAAKRAGAKWGTTYHQPVNNGSVGTSTPGVAEIVSEATQMLVYPNLAGSGWTASGGKRAPSLTITYEAEP